LLLVAYNYLLAYHNIHEIQIKINRKIAAGRFALNVALALPNPVITHMELRFAQGSGGHYVQSVLTVTHDPDCADWVCDTVWNTEHRITDWWTVESSVESQMNERSPYTITYNHDTVTVDTITDQDHVLFLAHSHWATAWDYVANGNWMNWRVRNHPNPDLWNTQWTESQQCTAIDWVHQPLLDWAGYSRLCAKFDLEPCAQVERLHQQYHQCRHQAILQYKQWADTEWDTVNAQISEWYQQYAIK